MRCKATLADMARVVAAGCGLSHGRPDKLDLDKADVQLMLEAWLGVHTPDGKGPGEDGVNLRAGDDGMFSYSLDIKTYDVLRRTDHVVRRT